jgi:hypothetical protein
MDSHSSLKIRTDLLLCYAFTCRGDNSWNLKISTVGYFTFKLGVKYFPDVGVNGIYILRSVWRKSKKNNFGHFEQTSLVRNNDVTCCPFGAIGFLLFSRWELGDEPYPSFTSRDQYYDIYLVEGSSARTPLTYPKVYQELKDKYGVTRRKHLWISVEKIMEEGVDESCALLHSTNLMKSNGKKKLRGFCDFLKVKISSYVVTDGLFSTWLE